MNENNPALTRETICRQTLERYSGSDIEDFQPYILLTNFTNYLSIYEEMSKLPLERFAGSVLEGIHDKDNEITLINFSVGAPLAALVVDVLSAARPKAVLLLGMCGGLHRASKIGQFIIPMAAIRDEGVSVHYMPAQVPSLPSLLVQKCVADVFIESDRYEDRWHTGVIHSTDYRMWEFDEAFRKKLIEEKATAIDMECSALFTAAFRKKVPIGALMLISDLPLKPDGIKTKASSRQIFAEFSKAHIHIGSLAIEKMQQLAEDEVNFRRFTFD